MARRYMKVIKKIAFHLLVILLMPAWIMSLYWLVRGPFMGIGDMFRNPPMWISTRWRLENYEDALTALPFVRYFLNTVLIVCFSVIDVLVSCSLSTCSLGRIKWNYRGTVFTILTSTTILPYFTTLVPNPIMWKKLGSISTFIPMIVPTWFRMGIASAYDGGVFSILLLHQLIRAISKELDEAVFVDGAGYWAVSTQIILPLSKPPLTYVGLSTFLNSWDDLVNPLIYLNSDEKYMIQLGPRTLIGYFSAERHLMVVVACAAIIPVVLVFLARQKYFVEGIVTMGLKG